MDLRFVGISVLRKILGSMDLKLWTCCRTWNFQRWMVIPRLRISSTSAGTTNMPRFGSWLRVRRRCSMKTIVRAVIMWIKTKILWRKISLPKGHSARTWWSADFSTCSPRVSLSNLGLLWIGIDILLSRVDWTRFHGLRLGGEDGGSGKMFVSSKGILQLA